MNSPVACLLAISSLYMCSLPQVMWGEIAEPENVLGIVVPHFEASGSIDDALTELAMQIRLRAVIGFEQQNGPASRFSLSLNGATVGQIVDRLCADDQRHEIRVVSDPRVINILLKRHHNGKQDLLSLHLQQFDMVTDDWPQNWASRLPEFSPEISHFLSHYHRLHGGDSITSGSPGITMEGNARPPHIEVHLTNVSVRDILNFVAIKSLELSQTPGATAPGITLFPEGWKCRLTEPAKAPMGAWQRSVFSAFPL